VSARTPRDAARAAPRAPAARGGARSARSEAATLLTADELAARWRVRKSHIYAMAREGDLPHVRLGKYVRFREQAVAAWLDEQEGRD
jgi:excisionase family DNA binding protein